MLPWGSTTGEETEALSNMLLMQPEYGEKTGTAKDELQWDTTFGSFADGSAQRVELISTVPALAAHSAKGLAAALRWLKAAIGLNLTAPASDQIAMVAEWLTLAATLLVLCALVPLGELLLRLPGLCTVVQPLPSGDHLAGWGKRWGSALFFVLAAGASYPVMTWLGQKLPGQVFRIPAGNGFFAWYGLLAVVLLLANWITCQRARRRGQIINCYDMGLSSARWPEHIDLGLYLWSLLLAALGGWHDLWDERPVPVAVPAGAAIRPTSVLPLCPGACRADRNLLSGHYPVLFGVQQPVFGPEPDKSGISAGHPGLFRLLVALLPGHGRECTAGAGGLCGGAAVRLWGGCFPGRGLW